MSQSLHGNGGPDAPTGVGAIAQRLRSLAADLHRSQATGSGPGGNARLSEVAVRMQELAAELDRQDDLVVEGPGGGRDADAVSGEPSPDPANFGPGDAAAGPQPVGFDASPEGDHPGR